MTQDNVLFEDVFEGNLDTLLIMIQDYYCKYWNKSIDWDGENYFDNYTDMGIRFIRHYDNIFGGFPQGYEIESLDYITGKFYEIGKELKMIYLHTCKDTGQEKDLFFSVN